MLIAQFQLQKKNVVVGDTFVTVVYRGYICIVLVLFFALHFDACIKNDNKYFILIAKFL